MDDGAHFSAIAATELCVLRLSLGFRQVSYYEPGTALVADFEYWQYRSGNIASPKD